jgi:non-homologous end joining protein Ku
MAKTETDAAPGNVINIMDALKKSIASEGRSKPK